MKQFPSDQSIAPPARTEGEELSLPSRKHFSSDPAGYALQTLETELLCRGISKRVFFSHPELAILELAPAISTIPLQRERIGVYMALLEPCMTNESYRRYICEKMPHILRHASKREKIFLLRYALSGNNRRVRGGLAFAILRSAQSAAELRTLASEKRSVDLLRTGHKELRELVVKSLYSRMFRVIGFPPGISRGVSARCVQNPKEARQKVRERLNEIHRTLKEYEKEINRHPRFRKTRTTKEHKRSIKEALAMVSPHVSRNGYSPRIMISRYNGARLANLLSLKVRAELSYGIHFAPTHSAMPPRAKRWSHHDIRAVLGALTKMPEGSLVMTPLLHKFVRTSRNHDFGLRRPNGVIELSDRAQHDHRVSRVFGGAKGLQVVALHELGHALQIGASNYRVSWSRDTGDIRGPGDAMYDFKSFCKLSGWKMVTERNWSQLFNNQAVSVAGERYPLNSPTLYKGARVVFTVLSEGGCQYLLVRNADAQFPVSKNAEADPWEDWAEGFCEYIIVPERLVVFAPEKFLYYQLHFRMYAEDSSEVQSFHQRIGLSIGV
jgi:hypothetical protein